MFLEKRETKYRFDSNEISAENRHSVEPELVYTLTLVEPVALWEVVVRWDQEEVQFSLWGGGDNASNGVHGRSH